MIYIAESVDAYPEYYCMTKSKERAMNFIKSCKENLHLKQIADLDFPVYVAFNRKELIYYSKKTLIALLEYHIKHKSYLKLKDEDDQLFRIDLIEHEIFFDESDPYAISPAHSHYHKSRFESYIKFKSDNMLKIKRYKYLVKIRIPFITKFVIGFGGYK